MHCLVICLRLCAQSVPPRLRIAHLDFLQPCELLSVLAYGDSPQSRLRPAIPLLRVPSRNFPRDFFLQKSCGRLILFGCLILPIQCAVGLLCVWPHADASLFRAASVLPLFSYGAVFPSPVIPVMLLVALHSLLNQSGYFIIPPMSHPLYS